MASSKREKELARQRAERQSARRTAAAQRRKQRNAVLASVVAVALVVASAVGIGLAVTGGDDEDTALAAPVASASAVPEESQAPESPAPSEAPSAEPTATDGACAYETTGDPAAKPAPVPPTTDVEDELVLTATLATSQGEIAFEMDTAAAPCTANSLRSLADAGYFDDTPCHRLTTSGISVLQCGDPTGTGSGGPGYEFADENLEGATYPRGTVAMANAGPGTNGSQFFLVYADTQLPPAYTPFGTITAGLEVLEKVAAAGSDGSNGAGDGAPNLPVQIQTLRVTSPAS